MTNEAGKAHGSDWLKWLGHLAGKSDVIGLEIGTFRGESAEWMCQNIFTHPTALYYCVDHFGGNVEHAIGKIEISTLEADARTRLAPFPQVRIIKEYSKNVLPVFLEKLDFCYVDGAHDAMNVLRDSVMAFDLLKPGGRLIWDDYLWEVLTDPRDKPKLAIDYFLACYERQLKVIEPRGWQICVEKL